MLLLAAWPFVYFWPVTLAQRVWFTTDVLRLFYPFGVELARALAEGRLPLWSPGILAGLPLLAEGQVGALYPPNLVLYRLLPTHLALSFEIILHLAWAGCGMYLSARSMGLASTSSLLAGFVFSFTSFIFGHLSHPAVIATISWLPWLILCQIQFWKADSASARAKWFFLQVFGLALQFLPGSAQMAFLNGLAFSFFGLFAAWRGSGPSRVSLARENRPESRFHPETRFLPEIGFLRPLISRVLLTAFALLLGAGIAAIQLVPTAELIGYSERSSTDESFFTSYSLPPRFLAQLVWPFLEGEPAEETGEFWVYFGLAPFLLAVIAPFLLRDRRALVLAAFGLVALSLALGGLNPAYRLLQYLPVFGYFRVPARYSYLMILAAAYLSAIALDTLAKRLDDSTSQRTVFPIAILSAAVVLVSILLAYSQPLEFWLSVWRVLPLVIGSLTLFAVAVAFRRVVPRTVWSTLVLGLVVFDLSSYAPPFLATIDALTPVDYVEIVPRSVSALEPARSPERIAPNVSLFPSVPALRGSLFPNTAMLYGRESVSGYTSLAFARHSRYLFDPTPAMLNLMNVRYMTIALEPRPLSLASTPAIARSPDILDEGYSIPATSAALIEVSSYTEEAAGLPDGTLVGQVIIKTDDGTVEIVPLRVGIETADWDHDRKQALGEARGNQAPVARTFPGFWRSFGRTFQGHTYLARHALGSSGEERRVVHVSVKSERPSARLAIESITLQNRKGESVSLAQLAGAPNLRLVYMSDTVAIWENLDVLPRAFVVHEALVLDDEAALAKLRSPDWQPDRTVILSDGTAMPATVSAGSGEDVVSIVEYRPERIQIDVTTSRPGYLVLSDSWYPGWTALVDGQPAEIHRADHILRAVTVGPGHHTVTFQYQPMSFAIGAIVSAASLLAAIGLSLFVGARAGSWLGGRGS